MGSMKLLPHTRACFVCGDNNPIGLNLRFETDDEVARCWFTPRPEHSGFQDTVHGGVTATVLDEVMVWAVGVKLRRFVYCAEMTVRYVNPGRPGVRMMGLGKLVLNRRDRIFETEGELRTEQGLLVATSTGKYLPVPDSVTDRVLQDFTGDAVLLEKFIESFKQARRLPPTGGAAPGQVS